MGVFHIHSTRMSADSERFFQSFFHLQQKQKLYLRMEI